MRRRRTRRGDGQNADSLLDTMANVVGILVVLMAVTQLTVNDAMKRIQVFESEESATVRAEQDEARARLASIGGDALGSALTLARLRERVRELRTTETGSPSDLATVSANVAQQRMRVRKLEKSIAEKREQLANLKILLDDAEERAQEEGLALRLPDPRPPPLAAKQLLVFCRYGRVFDPRFDKLERELVEVIRTAPSPLPRYFEAYDIGNELLRWKMMDRATARLTWRSTDIGETVAQLRSPGGAFQQALDAYDSKDRFLHFYVWEDSFEVYLDARRIAEEKGFAVGWQPIPNSRPLDFTRSRKPRNPTPVD